MLRALSEYHVSGIQTNLGLFRSILRDSEFREGRLDTAFLERFFARQGKPAKPDPVIEDLAATVARYAAESSKKLPAKPEPHRSRWLTTGRADFLR